MAVASLVYTNGLLNIVNGTLSWASGGSAFKIALSLDSEDPDRDADDDRADVSQPTGGNAAAGIDITESNPTEGTDVLYMGGTDSDYTFTGLDAAQAVGGTIVFYGSGAAATDTLICMNDFTGGNVTTQAGVDIVVTPNANGLWQISVA